MILVSFLLFFHDDNIFSKPRNTSSISICMSTTCILTCHNKNLVLRSNKGISYFMVAIDKTEKTLMALIPLVEINDTIMKYETNNQHHFYVETLAGKTTGRGESFTMNMRKI